MVKASTKLRELTTRPVSSLECQKASVILNRAHDSASSILRGFGAFRKSRQARGMSTDDEQDLLRAMLVMMAAGLDAMLKQLIRDALPTLVKIEPQVMEGLEKFIQRQLRVEGDGVFLIGAGKFLAKILAAPSQQSQVIEEYIQKLTGGSLQSADQLLTTAGALGVPREKLGVDVQDLKEVFRIRNQIIHEFDINLEGQRRKRNLRGRDDMVNFTDMLLGLAQNIRDDIDDRIAKASVTSDAFLF